MANKVKIECPTCKGSGLVLTSNDHAICPSCLGSGNVGDAEVYTFDVLPPRISEQQQIDELRLIIQELTQRLEVLEDRTSDD